MSIPTIEAGGVAIPVLGFGTWNLRGDDCRRAVEEALALGYRHIDTAVVYGNEAEVGAAIAASGLPREALFVTTKIPRRELTKDLVWPTLEGSLERLGLGHVDLLLIHWPNPDVSLAETLEAFDAARAAGLTRAIGVSNFSSRLMREAVALTEAPIATNQVEFHPYLSQATLLATLRELRVPLTAYSPLAHGRVADDPTLTAMAAEHGVSVGQLVLRWLIQHGDMIAIPKTGNRERAAQNLDVFSFQLTDDERAAISLLARPDGRGTNADGVEWD